MARTPKPGDGSSRKPYRFWHPLYRSVFLLDTEEPDGRHRYEVDIDFFDEKSRVYLYRDGAQAAYSTLPARLPVPGGTIEVKTSTFGLRRMHLVTDDGAARMLTPHPRSGEGLRAALADRHPGLSRALSVSAVLVLLVALVLGLPQIIEALSQVEIIADNVGTFTSPFSLPSWANTALLIAGIAASIERALTLKYHWLLDNDTGLMDL